MARAYRISCLGLSGAKAADSGRLAQENRRLACKGRPPHTIHLSWLSRRPGAFAKAMADTHARGGLLMIGQTFRHNDLRIPLKSVPVGQAKPLTSD
jgi:hypothetical protein